MEADVNGKLSMAKVAAIVFAVITLVGGVVGPWILLSREVTRLDERSAGVLLRIAELKEEDKDRAQEIAAVRERMAVAEAKGAEQSRELINIKNDVGAIKTILTEVRDSVRDMRAQPQTKP